MQTLKLGLLFFISFTLIGCSHDLRGYAKAGQSAVISVSSDGDYALSNSSKKIILWNIKNKTRKIISYNGNIYSPYFIKNTHLFMWQDLNDYVHVQNVNGKEVFKFHSFPSYGEVITSDLQYYFASDIDWNVYSIHNGKLKLIHFDNGGFLGFEKLLNLTLSADNRLLLMSGYTGNQGDNLPLSIGLTVHDLNPEVPLKENSSIVDGVTLWQVKTGTPLFKFTGNISKTYATLSPNSKYVVSGDENENIFIWNTNTGEKYLDINTYESSIPKNLNDRSLSDSINSVIAIKFIDMDDDYLRFTANLRNYAILYNVNNPKMIKWVSLGNYPSIGVDDDYSRDQAFDTAPAANILVVAQQNGPGIVVYKYHPNTQTLEKIWAPGADGWHLLKIAFLNLASGALITFFLLQRSLRFLPFLFAAAILLLIATPFAYSGIAFWTYEELGIAMGFLTFAIGIFISSFLLHYLQKINHLRKNVLVFHTEKN